MRYLYAICLFSLVCFAPPAKAQTELTDDDRREIRAEAKKVIETHLSDLLNTVANSGMGEQGRKLIMANSFIPSENQIFDINSIIEDDINPEYTINKKGYSDVKVQRYLENLNLFYTKSEENSITVSEVNVTDVRKGAEYPFVLVHFKMQFNNTHRNKPTLKYAPVLRTAELKAEKEGKQWRVLITGIRYFKASITEPVAAKSQNKPSQIEKQAAKQNSGKATTQKAEEKKSEPFRDIAQTQPIEKNEQAIPVETKPAVSATVMDKKQEVVKVQEKSPELVPQKSNAATQLLEQQAVKYKKQTTLFRVGAGVAVAGAAATFVILNGAYSDYKKQLDQNNVEFENWFKSDGHGANFGDVNNYKAQPKSMIEFSSPGIYFVGVGVIAGGVLWFLGNGSNKKAKDYRRQLEQKRKQLSILPQLAGPQRYAGLQIKYRF